MIAVALGFTSCLKNDADNTDSVVYNETAITGFSLYAVNRYVHTSTSTGADSVYTKALTVKEYPFSIDQYARKIYNTDSLPADCDVKHVLATISTSTYSGSIILVSLIGDTLSYYSSSDSIDFSQPRELRVYNSSMEHYRSYTVQVNVKKGASADLLEWEPLRRGAGDTFAGLLGTAQVADASQESFRLSLDSGSTWSSETLGAEEDAAYLPSGEVGYTAFSMAGNNDKKYHLMAGPLPGNDYMCTVWRKISTDGSGNWTCLLNLPLPENTKYAGHLPTADHISLLWGKGRILALTDSGAVYESLDQGFSWHTFDDFNLPEGATDHLRAAQDEAGTIWLLKEDGETGMAWRGKFTE